MFSELRSASGLSAPACARMDSAKSLWRRRARADARRTVVPSVRTDRRGKRCIRFQLVQARACEVNDEAILASHRAGVDDVATDEGIDHPTELRLRRSSDRRSSTDTSGRALSRRPRNPAATRTRRCYPGDSFLVGNCTSKSGRVQAFSSRTIAPACAGSSFQHPHRMRSACPAAAARIRCLPEKL